MLTHVFQANECFQLHIHIEKTKSPIFCRRKQKITQKLQQVSQGGQRGQFYPLTKDYERAIKQILLSHEEPYPGPAVEREKNFPPSHGTDVKGHMYCSCGKN